MPLIECEDAGEAIRRRRECLACQARFTTFERLEQSALTLALRERPVGPYDPVPGNVRIVGCVQHRAGEPGRAWREIAVRPNEPRRDRAHAVPGQGSVALPAAAIRVEPTSPV